MKNYSQMTPSIRTRGTWSVRQPFTINDRAIYTCVAVRTFKDFFADGADPMELVYSPVGIVEGQSIDGTVFSLKEEEIKGINIISIADATGNVIHIPDNFILSYPNSSTVVYEHVILTCSLGPLPSGTDTSNAEAAVKDAVKNAFGITSTVKIARAPSLNAVTYEEHLMLERARTNAIKVDKTSDGKIKELEDKLNLANKTIATLKQLCVDNNLFPG